MSGAQIVRELLAHADQRHLFRCGRRDARPGPRPHDDGSARRGGLFPHLQSVSSLPLHVRRWLTRPVVEIAECALALALEKDALPPLGRTGGVLTPASALGDVLVRRLEATGRFAFTSERLDAAGRVVPA
jgi:hypothetical protein